MADGDEEEEEEEEGFDDDDNDGNDDHNDSHDNHDDEEDEDVPAPSPCTESLNTRITSSPKHLDWFLHSLPPPPKETLSRETIYIWCDIQEYKQVVTSVIVRTCHLRHRIVKIVFSTNLREAD